MSSPFLTPTPLESAAGELFTRSPSTSDTAKGLYKAGNKKDKVWPFFATNNEE
jgi:hypothetical protein